MDWSTLTAPCRDVFGERAAGYAVTWLPAAGGSYPIDGIFDDAYREVSFGGAGNAVSSTHPTLGVRVADLPASPLQGDRVLLSRNAKTYVVKEVRPDSHGWAILFLNKYSGPPLVASPAPAPDIAEAAIGGYTILEDAGENLVIRAPDGSITPLVEKS